MGQYLLSVHHRDGEPLQPPEVDPATIYAGVSAFNHELRESGAWVFAGGLLPVDSATVVDGRGPEVILTDGPFAETKEHLGGFWVVEAADRAAALEWARKGSRACAAPVELRPFQAEPTS